MKLLTLNIQALGYKPKFAFWPTICMTRHPGNLDDGKPAALLVWLEYVYYHPAYKKPFHRSYANPPKP